MPVVQYFNMPVSLANIMWGSMRKLFSVISQLIGASILSLLINSLAMAHDSVVVVPLNTCKEDPNLVPENIPVGVTICGVAGTLKVSDFFVDQGNGTVIDSSTGLMWQQVDDGNMYNWYRAAGVVEAALNPDGAIDVCGNLTLGGHNDWRLPTKDELKGLVWCSNGTSTPLPDGDSCGSGYNSPTINSIFSCRPDIYWSASGYDEISAWFVYFDEGFAAWSYRSLNFYVRCVR